MRHEVTIKLIATTPDYSSKDVVTHFMNLLTDEAVLLLLQEESIDVELSDKIVARPLDEPKLDQWTCRESLGGIPVHPLPEGYSPDDAPWCHEDLAEILHKDNTITDPQGLHEGLVLCCPTITGGWALARVGVEGNHATAIGGKMMFFLVYEEGVWGCYGSGNLAAIKKLDLCKEKP